MSFCWGNLNLERVAMFKRLKESLKKKELDDKHKDVELEKNDFLAIVIALSMYMIPALIIVFGSLALVIWIIF